MYWLHTARLGFRDWSSKDEDLAMALWGHPEVTRRITAKGAFTHAEVLNKWKLEQKLLKEHGVQYWPLFLLKSGEFVGCCGLRPYGEEEGVFELGCHILPQHWRKGYAFEAISSVISHAFGELQARRLFAGHHPENLASKRLLERLGFAYTHHELYPPTGLEHPSYQLLPTVSKC